MFNIIYTYIYIYLYVYIYIYIHMHTHTHHIHHLHGVKSDLLRFRIAPSVFCFRRFRWGTWHRPLAQPGSGVSLPRWIYLWAFFWGVLFFIENKWTPNSWIAMIFEILRFVSLGFRNMEQQNSIHHHSPPFCRWGTIIICLPLDFWLAKCYHPKISCVEFLGLWTPSYHVRVVNHQRLGPQKSQNILS